MRVGLAGSASACSGQAPGLPHEGHLLFTGLHALYTRFVCVLQVYMYRFAGCGFGFGPSCLGSTRSVVSGCLPLVACMLHLLGYCHYPMLLCYACYATATTAYYP
jgi:hypothetical protein